MNRYDEEKNHYFILNNVTGESIKVHRTGDFIKKFDATLTGSANYHERIERAANVLNKNILIKT